MSAKDYEGTRGKGNEFFRQPGRGLSSNSGNLLNSRSLQNKLQEALRRFSDGQVPRGHYPGLQTVVLRRGR